MAFETIPASVIQKVSGGTSQDKADRSFKVTISFRDNEKEGRVVLSGEDLSEISRRINYPLQKENYYILAINNLIKKSDFLQLTLQHVERLINDDEFENELEANSDRYLIELKNKPKEEDINIICDIVDKINREFTIDEVSEMFSIAPDCLNNRLFLNR